MPSLVPGGAIDRKCKAVGATPSTDEQTVAGVARVMTDKGEVVWVDGWAEAQLIPFGDAE